MVSYNHLPPSPKSQKKLKNGIVMGIGHVTHLPPIMDGIGPMTSGTTQLVSKDQKIWNHFVTKCSFCYKMFILLQNVHFVITVTVPLMGMGVLFSRLHDFCQIRLKTDLNMLSRFIGIRIRRIRQD